MAQTTFTITEAGVIVDLVVGASRELVAARAVGPPPLLVRALIDTGSDETIIDVNVVKQLDIKPKRPVLLLTAAMDKPAEFYEYDVSLGITAPSGAISIPSTWRVLCGDMEPSAPFDAVIGRDVLALFEMVYNGPNQIFMFNH